MEAEVEEGEPEGEDEKGLFDKVEEEEDGPKPKRPKLEDPVDEYDSLLDGDWGDDIKEEEQGNG